MASLFRLRINIYGVYTARLGYFRFHGRHLDFWQKFFLTLGAAQTYQLCITLVAGKRVLYCEFKLCITY